MFEVVDRKEGHKLGRRGGGCLVGVQAESLSMPGGRHLKENLYSSDGATDICVWFCARLCVYVCTLDCLCACVPPLNGWLIR